MAVGDFSTAMASSNPVGGKPCPPDQSTGAYTNSGVSGSLGKGDGTFQPAVNYAAGTAPDSVAVGDFAIDSVAVGDFNADGKLDVVVADYGSYGQNNRTYTNSGISVLLGKGDGTFQAASNYSTGPFPRSVAVGDFDGDGKLDLVVANAFSFIFGYVSVY